MRWFRRRDRKVPRDLAERFTQRGLLRNDSETAELTDRATVQRWARELGRDHDQQVLVHRTWGTVAAVAERRHGPRVFLSDGDTTWVAAVPGTDGDENLTGEQVEHVLVDALTSPGPPEWPDWRRFL